MDGGTGTDTASYATALIGVGVNLFGGVVGGGDSAGDSYVSVENVVGSGFSDGIIGDDGANGLWGMVGNDYLSGGGGADTLKGGAGADTFNYETVSDSTASARDTISDFSHAEGDVIDLWGVDADGNAGNGDTAFTFLGGAAFTGAGHELRVVASGGAQIVLADVNGDMVADMQIVVVSATTLVASDFLL
ncbi:MAG: M10 family metallopeptidase C-terminal domain-containing protein [Inquilinus limosus]|uniref:M10 family metallopeptidase C-terminal domain-containing protein n=1 Tax=Inquilinus limosus TaxID=171674 RepID=A0A952FII4_9PROT|nr:M10 family metallopeptidase C-terminal domain-containing protein [Inquilinus limosus]